MSGNQSGAWKKVRAWLGQPERPQTPKAKTAETLQVESLEPRLAMAVAPININMTGGTTGIDIYDSRAGAELVTAWVADRNYRAPGGSAGGLSVTTAAGGFSINDVTVNETDGTATFTVTRTTNPTRTATIDFATSDGTAIAGSDYTATSGTLNFAVGQTSATITVNLIDYNAAEATETFNVTLSNATETSGVLTPATLRILDATGVGTILDNDPTPTFSIDDVTVDEADASVTFTITRGGNTAGAVSVDYTTVDGTAIAGSDYEPTSGTLTFADGVASMTVTVNITDEDLYEGDETFTLQLSNAQNLEGGSVTISDADGLGTILNDDAVPEITVSDVLVDEAAGTLTFDITLSNPAGFDITYDYALVDGTATAGLDYTGASGSRTIAAGATTDTIVVPITDDILVEGLEDFTLQLTNVVVQSTPTVTITLVDLDGLGEIEDNDCEIDIADATLDEDNGNMTFTLTRSGGLNITTVVTFSVASGTAIAGTDFTVPSPLTVTFNPGDTTATIDVAITADTRYENDETLTVTLVSATNSPNGTATLGTATATGTITNDDAPPDISIDDVRLNERDGTFTFTVTLSAVSDVAVTFDYDTADGTATAPGDYDLTSGSGTIAAGSTTATITVGVNEDSIVETTDDTFFVNLSNITNANVANVGDDVGQGSIIDNDASVSIVATASATEGTGVNMTFAVTQVAHPDVVTTVDWEAVEAGSGTNFATQTLDFSPNTGALTMTGSSSQNILIPILNDTLPYEGNEAFLVNLTGVTVSGGGTGTIASGTSTGTIIDDELQPNLVINNVSGLENISGTGTANSLTFTVTLNGTPASAVTVQYGTQQQTATAGVDYTVTGGTLTFSAGVANQTQTITVPLTNDTTAESDETFNMILFNVSGGQAIIADNTGAATIINNDHVITMIDRTLAESAGTNGPGNNLFELFLSGDNTQGGVTVQVQTQDNTAVAGGSGPGSDDFDGTAGVFQTFSFGVAPGPYLLDNTHVPGFPLRINQDTVDEPDQTFFVNLVSAASASGGTVTIGTNQATVTIQDDDATPTITVDDVSVSEGQTATFTITLTGSSDSTVTVNLHTDNISAVNGADYAGIPINIPFTFLPSFSNQSQTISIGTVEDQVVEGTETFQVHLVSPVNAVFGDNIGIGTIRNDDFNLSGADPNFDRPDNSFVPPGTPTNGILHSVDYEQFTFTHGGGALNIITNATSSDPFIVLYAGSFNPANPTLNAVAADDDIVAGILLNSQITGTFAAGTYVLVVTKFDNGTADFDYGFTINGVEFAI